MRLQPDVVRWSMRYDRNPTWCDGARDAMGAREKNGCCGSAISALEEYISKHGQPLFESVRPDTLTTVMEWNGKFGNGVRSSAISYPMPSDNIISRIWNMRMCGFPTGPSGNMSCLHSDTDAECIKQEAF